MLVLQPGGNREYLVGLCTKLTRQLLAEIELVVPKADGTAVIISVPTDLDSLLYWLRSQPEVVDAREDTDCLLPRSDAALGAKSPMQSQRECHRSIRVVFGSS